MYRILGLDLGLNTGSVTYWWYSTLFYFGILIYKMILFNSYAVLGIKLVNSANIKHVLRTVYCSCLLKMKQLTKNMKSSAVGSWCSSGLHTCGPYADCGPLPLFEIKFYWNIATSIHLCITCSCFCAATAELSNFNRDCMDCKA